jgi:hypothetical protein
MRKKIMIVSLAILLAIGGVFYVSAGDEAVCGCGCGHPVIEGQTHCGCGWTPSNA